MDPAAVWRSFQEAQAANDLWAMHEHAEALNNYMLNDGAWPDDLDKDAVHQAVMDILVPF